VIEAFLPYIRRLERILSLRRQRLFSFKINDKQQFYKFQNSRVVFDTQLN
jgi:hypothetical protein